MKFLNAIGALPEADAESVSEEERLILVETARLFFDAGGIITLDDWRDMTSLERGVLGEAAEHHRMKVAGTTALAFHSAEYAADLLSPYDGGATKDGMEAAKIDQILNGVLDKRYGPINGRR